MCLYFFNIRIVENREYIDAYNVLGTNIAQGVVLSGVYICMYQYAYISAFNWKRTHKYTYTDTNIHTYARTTDTNRDGSREVADRQHNQVAAADRGGARENQTEIRGDT